MSKPFFSACSRKDRMKQMENKRLDLLVIGGGITGAGIALDASVRGLNTGLIDMQDFASGTSSRSTKLIHGGLRYLKKFELKLVAEVGKERATVYKNAPHVISPQWMMLPIYKNGSFSKIMTSIGLKVYDNLANVKRNERRYMIGREETLKKLPLLKEEGLRGCGVYVEYRTDDARLTLEVIKRAEEFGANPVNYMKVEEFLYEDNKVVGVKVRDVFDDEIYQIYASSIVNATGPWVDTLREVDGSRYGKKLFLTKGVHLVIDKSQFPIHHAVYFDVEDGRMIFAIPRHEKVYIGTTDTVYQEDLKQPSVTREDVKYLLKAVNDTFPQVQLTEREVESSWAGLRPLIYEEGKSASDISRKDELFSSSSGLISIAGGKLTGYRKMAERVVNLVMKRLNRYAPCPTATVHLSGGKVDEHVSFNDWNQRLTTIGIKSGLTKEEAARIASFYGSNAEIVFSLIKSHGDQGKAYGLPPVLTGCLLYAIDYEMAVTPLDFFNRRTGYLYFNIHQVKNRQDDVLLFMSDKLLWSTDQVNKFQRELVEAIKNAQYSW